MDKATHVEDIEHRVRAIRQRIAAACVTAGREVDEVRPIHTFNLLALAAMAQHTDVFSRELQWWTFLLLFLAFEDEAFGGDPGPPPHGHQAFWGEQDPGGSGQVR